MSNENSDTAIAPILLLDAKGLSAAGFGSVRHVRRLDSSGRLPKPIKLGKRTLWSVAELQKWLAAGAPKRDAWEQMKNDRIRLSNRTGGRKTSETV